MDEAMLKSGQYPNVAIMAGTDPKEVMREHGQTDTEHMDNGVSVHICPNDAGAHSNVSQNLSDTREDMLRVDHEGNVTFCKIPDTRELLEADVRSEYYGGIESEAEEIIGWLDRQREITRRECADERENLLTEAIATCTKKISKLEAERDALKEQINRFDVPKSEEIAENDASKGVINIFDVQNDTREKLEADAENLLFEFGHYCATSREGLADDVYVFIGDLTDLLDRQAAITTAECTSEDESCCEACRAAQKREIAELTAERDALKAKLETYGKVPDQGEREELQPVESGDTREQLEADVRWELEHYFAWTKTRERLIEQACEWLDRQAAITERECMSRDTSERVGWDCAECAEGLGKELDARCDKLKERIAELTAEVEKHRQRANDAERGVLSDEWYVARDRYEDDIAELTAERDQLSRDLDAEHALVVQFEYDNEELKADLKTANDTINTLRASVAGLKETVEKLGAQ